VCLVWKEVIVLARNASRGSLFSFQGILKGLFRSLLRILLLAAGYFALPQFIAGLAFDSVGYLFLYAATVALTVGLVFPVLRLLALPADLFSLGLFSRVLFSVFVLMVLVASLWCLPGVAATSTTWPQHIQAILAYWVFTLTILAFTR
jgi:uncharacterized membrane protein YvlD (DUF360 family)